MKHPDRQMKHPDGQMKHLNAQIKHTEVHIKRVSKQLTNKVSPSCFKNIRQYFALNKAYYAHAHQATSGYLQMTSAQNCSPSRGPFNKNIISPAKTTTQLITPILSKQRQQQKLYHFQNPAKDMSLLRTIALRAPRAPLAATASKQVRFSTSPFQQKDAGSAVKDTIDSVNKTVSDAALKGIEKGGEFIPPTYNSVLRTSLP